MARNKPGRTSARRKFNLRRVRLATNTPIGALNTLTVGVGPLTNVTTNPMRCISIDASWSLVDLGATADDGQEFGVAHSDYTAAEIEACLESAGSIDIGDMLAQEVANRLVRSIGIMTESPGTGAGMGFNDGNPVKTRLNWAIGIGDRIQVWIRNGSGTIYTTGASLQTIGNMWVKDGL